MPKFSYSSILERNINLITTAIPSFNFETYDKKVKNRIRRHDVWGAEQFIFFNDSMFVCDKKNSANLSNGSLFTFTFCGSFKMLNDSIIELRYEGNNQAPNIIFDYNKEKPKELSISYKAKDMYEGANHLAKYTDWCWMTGDNVLMEYEPLFSKEDVYSIIPMDSIRTTKRVSNEFPKCISIRKSYLSNSLPSIIISTDTLNIKPKINYYIEDYYLIDISSPEKNYLNITDVRDSLNRDLVNDITIEFVSKPFYMWYPNILRFKKKRNHLVLLNHDGSETDIVLDILYEKE